MVESMEIYTPWITFIISWILRMIEFFKKSNLFNIFKNLLSIFYEKFQGVEPSKNLLKVKFILNIP